MLPAVGRHSSIRTANHSIESTVRPIVGCVWLMEWKMTVMLFWTWTLWSDLFQYTRECGTSSRSDHHKRFLVDFLMKSNANRRLASEFDSRVRKNYNPVQMPPSVCQQPGAVVCRLSVCLSVRWSDRLCPLLSELTGANCASVPGYKIGCWSFCTCRKNLFSITHP